MNETKKSKEEGQAFDMSRFMDISVKTAMQKLSDICLFYIWTENMKS